MSKEQPAASPEEISKWVRDAAVSASWRPSHQLGSGVAPAAEESSDFHIERIQAALRRARTKTFVRMVKPFRGIFRNQEAVNDSLIVAASHLAAQNEEMLEQISELRGLLQGLRSQLRHTAAQQTTSQNPAAGDASDSAPGRDASCA